MMKKLRQTIELGDQEFFQKTMDSMLSHIAILDENGSILVVNAAWNRFATQNGLEEGFSWLGSNYLRACDQASGECADGARRVADGIRDVIANRQADFRLEYPCHSPIARRWFSLRVTRFEIDGLVRVVVTHDDITERKLAEIRVRQANRLLKLQANTDGMTGIANRRSFDRELDREWRRLRKSGAPLSVALIDVDCFKQYNDREGHLAGDDALRAVAQAIQKTLKRPRDLAARYGGEEFAVILPGDSASRAAKVAIEILEAVRRLAIPHPNSRIVTVSIGCSTTIPALAETPIVLLLMADRALYRAKASGRDRWVESGPPEAISAPRISISREERI